MTSAIASTSTLPSTTTKISPRDWFQSIDSPKYVVAPMVDQSELAWRMISRLHGATLAYTPMFHAALFSNQINQKYFQEQFDIKPNSLEGVAPYDRPLIVQFCANDKELWLQAAQRVVGRCDAVDLNLGCPQGIAKRGKYGAFLMEEWELIGDMISHLHKQLPIAVTAKLRIFPSFDKTLEYATHLYNSGAQLLTVHGRLREAKGQMAGLASWSKIAHITKSLKDFVPIYANGGLPSAEEIKDCLEETGTDGVMSAEGNLYNPMIFSPANAEFGREYFKILPAPMQESLLKCNSQLVGESHSSPAYGPATFLAAQYLAIVKTLPSTETAPSAIKGHLFKLFRPIWATGKHLEMREQLGKAGGRKNTPYSERIETYEAVVEAMHKLILNDLEIGDLPAGSHRLLSHQQVLELYDGIIPYSHSQPYLRIPKVTEAEIEIESEPAVGQKRKIDLVESESDETTQAAIARAKAFLPPGTSKVLCSGSTSAQICLNLPAAKCPQAACSSCCPKMIELKVVEGENQMEGEGEVVQEGVCEVHETRLEKQKEKREFKKQGKILKKQAK